jgi:hypothetical protein
MSFDEPPKSKPPNIGKAPPKKVKKEVEEEKKGPALSSSKPSGGSKAPVKAITSVNVTEEDLGSGISAEQAEEKISQLFDAAVVAAFDDPAWKVQNEEGY